MKCEANTEQEMREAKVPTCHTIDELEEYIASLTEREHDYGTCCYAMSLAATAAFNYVASKLGVTGFQASCADLDVLRRTRNLKGPFLLIDGANMLYPQYDLHARLQEAMTQWREWASEEAGKLLDQEREGYVHPNVWAHWERLAGRGSNHE